MADMGDKRIVYGLCAFWGSINETVSTPARIPCCPFCRNVGFEMANLEEWYKGVDDYDKISPGYHSVQPDHE